MWGGGHPGRTSRRWGQGCSDWGGRAIPPLYSPGGGGRAARLHGTCSSSLPPPPRGWEPPPSVCPSLLRSVRPSLRLSGPPSVRPSLPPAVPPRGGDGARRWGRFSHTPHPHPGGWRGQGCFSRGPCCCLWSPKVVGVWGGNRWVVFFFFWKSSGGSRDSRSRIPAGGV